MTGKAGKAGVMGWPVGHSLSPRIHGFWLRRHGLEGSYEALAVAPAELEKELRSLPGRGFSGVNLTLPHKEKALLLMDHTEPLARRIGAVNTVIVHEDGTLEGRNTDVFGFRENLKTAGFEAANESVAVLGAGGAARAVLAALQEMGFSDIRLVNRTRDKAEACAADLCLPGAAITVLTPDSLPQALEGASLLVNATSLGMKGRPPLEIDLSPLPREAWVTDIVYNPLMTPLLQQARQKGHPVVDGLGMLLHQARPGFAAWFGVEPEVTDELRKAVLDEYES